MGLDYRQRYVSEYQPTRHMDPKGTFAAEIIDASPRAFAAGAIARQRDGVRHGGSDSMPEGSDSMPEGLLADTEMRLQYLGAALATGRNQLFHHHVGWSKIAYNARAVPLSLLEGNLRCLAVELEESMPAEPGQMARSYLDDAVSYLAKAPGEAPPALVEGAPHSDLAGRYLLAVLEMRQHDALAMLAEARDGGVPVNELYTDVVRPAQQEVGRLWQLGDISTSEEHYASRVAEFVMAQLAGGAPRLKSNGRRVIVTSVSGDLHEIAPRMIAAQFECAGWESILLGANTPTDDVVEMATMLNADLLALSATLAIHVRTVAELIQAVKRATPQKKLATLVGGMPFELVADLWEVVGADGTAADAVSAVATGEQLIS